MKTRHRVFVALLMAGALGALLAAPLGDRRQLSVEAWLGAAAGLLVLSVVSNVLRATPMASRPPLPFWSRERLPDGQRPTIPRGLGSLEGTLLSARDNRRAFTLRLQPRLDTVARHYLAMDHGLSTEESSGVGVAEALGDTAWMLDTAPSDRTPTPADVELFLDRLLVHRRRAADNYSGSQPASLELRDPEQQP